MPSNAEAASLLREIADLLDLQGERFKPEAYRRAARSVESLTEELGAVAGRHGLRDVPGIGEAIEAKVGEYLATGTIPYLERLRGEVPPGLLELMRLPGVGPKTTRRFWTELGVIDRTSLTGAIDSGRVAGLKGFGARKVEQLTAALAAGSTGPSSARTPIESVYGLARSIREALRSRSPTDQVEIAGSLRRFRETVGDLDFLVTSREPEKVFDVFSALPEVGEVRMRGPTKETVVLRTGLQVDLRVVRPEEFGAALQYFTGSKDHNVRLRSLARDRGLKINEYGVFREEERVGGRTEEEVYGLLGVPWIPPELREDHGEIDRAREGRLPTPVAANDLVGELHLHLPENAAPADLGPLRRRAEQLGLRYVGIVVAAVGGTGTTSQLSPEMRDAIRAPATGRFRWLEAVEVEPGADPAVVGRLGGAYRILRGPVDGAGPSAAADRWTGVRLIAHGPVASSDVRARIERARSAGAALEVGPGAERLDSVGAGAARERGVALAIPTALPGGEATVVHEIALGFARRAGATRDEIANAQPWCEPTAGQTVGGRRRATAT